MFHHHTWFAFAFVFFFSAPAGLFAAPGETAERPAKRSLLIVDGMNNHDWPRATKILKGILQGGGRFNVDVSTSPTADAPFRAWQQWRPPFARYDVVLSNFNGGHTPGSVHWQPEVERALEDYVRGGGGLVIYHSANNAFPDWPAYNEMIGLGWRNPDFGPGLIVGSDEKVIEIPQGSGRGPGHGPEHDFQVTTLSGDHPITRGLPKMWMHPQEQLSHGQRGPAKHLTVLSYAFSKDTGDNEVMEWVVPFGKGRVYVTMLGHLWKNKPDDAMRCIGFQTTLIRGCQWAATGKAPYPLSKDFPTESEMRLRADAVVKKPSDRVTEIRNGSGTIFSVRSPSGIGSATIYGPAWPEDVRLRLHLSALEGLSVSNGSVELMASVLSHSGYKRLLRVRVGGREQAVDAAGPYWTEIGAFDATGKPAQGLPERGGYFEMALPPALLKTNPKSLTVAWIDAYR